MPTRGLGGTAGRVGIEGGGIDDREDGTPATGATSYTAADETAATTMPWLLGPARASWLQTLVVTVCAVPQAPALHPPSSPKPRTTGCTWRTRSSTTSPSSSVVRRPPSYTSTLRAATGMEGSCAPASRSASGPSERRLSCRPSELRLLRPQHRARPPRYESRLFFFSKNEKPENILSKYSILCIADMKSSRAVVAFLCTLLVPAALGLKFVRDLYDTCFKISPYSETIISTSRSIEDRAKGNRAPTPHSFPRLGGRARPQNKFQSFGISLDDLIYFYK